MSEISNPADKQPDPSRRRFLKGAGLVAAGAAAAKVVPPAVKGAVWFADYGINHEDKDRAHKKEIKRLTAEMKADHDAAVEAIEKEAQINRDFVSKAGERAREVSRAIADMSEADRQAKGISAKTEIIESTDADDKPVKLLVQKISATYNEDAKYREIFGQSSLTVTSLIDGDLPADFMQLPESDLAKHLTPWSVETEEAGVMRASISGTEVGLNFIYGGDATFSYEDFPQREIYASKPPKYEEFDKDSFINELPDLKSLERYAEDSGLVRSAIATTSWSIAGEVNLN